MEAAGRRSGRPPWRIHAAADSGAAAGFRLDARIDRNATIAGKPVIVFVGVQNVTGRRNVSGYSWNRATNAADANKQLGVFPLLGLEWRF